MEKNIISTFMIGLIGALMTISTASATNVMQIPENKRLQSTILALINDEFNRCLITKSTFKATSDDILIKQSFRNWNKYYPQNRSERSGCVLCRW